MKNKPKQLTLLWVCSWCKKPLETERYSCPSCGGPMKRSWEVKVSGQKQPLFPFLKEKNHDQ